MFKFTLELKGDAQITERVNFERQISNYYGNLFKEIKILHENTDVTIVCVQ